MFNKILTLSTSIPARILAYGNQRVANLGQIQLDVVFDGGSRVEKQDFLVMEAGFMPVLGTNILVGQDGKFSLDSENLRAKLHGKEVQIFTEVTVDKKINVLSKGDYRHLKGSSSRMSQEHIRKQDPLAHALGP